MTVVDQVVARNPPHLFAYVTQTVPSAKLTQGKCGIGVGILRTL